MDLQEQLASALRERDEARDQRDRAIEEKDAWHLRHQQSCRDRDRLLRQRDEATASYLTKRLECDELAAKLGEIRSAYDICSKVGRPCASCMEAHGRQLAEMREVIRMFYDECKCKHDGIDQANIRAYSILHRFA